MFSCCHCLGLHLRLLDGHTALCDFRVSSVQVSHLADVICLQWPKLLKNIVSRWFLGERGSARLQINSSSWLFIPVSILVRFYAVLTLQHPEGQNFDGSSHGQFYVWPGCNGGGLCSCQHIGHLAPPLVPSFMPDPSLTLPLFPLIFFFFRPFSSRSRAVKGHSYYVFFFFLLTMHPHSAVEFRNPNRLRWRGARVCHAHCPCAV